MAITKDKVASVLVFVLIAFAVMAGLHSLAIPALALAFGLLVSSFGLALIWLAEPLGEIGCFSRGLAHRSPPAMIEAFGWIFLIGYPLFLTTLLW